MQPTRKLAADLQRWEARNDMAKPDWFILLDQWKQKGRGEFGHTLPFLVGAIAYKYGQTDLSSQHIRNFLNEIAYNPVEGYFTEVRWCHDIDAPVFNTRPNDWPYKLPSSVAIPHPSGEGKSIVFSKDLQSSFHLNSTNPETLLCRLAEQATGPISQGRFSRNRKKEGIGYEFREFSAADLEYIHNTIMAPNNSFQQTARAEPILEGDA